MSKTKELPIECMEVRITPNRYNKVSVLVEEPILDDLLANIHKDDIVEWFVGQNFNPEDIFNQSELEKWAESEGYIKAETQND